MNFTRTIQLIAALLAIHILLIGDVSATEPLHRRIDRLLEQSHSQFNEIKSAPAGDSEFLRRIYLDLAGRIPSRIEVRRFLKDATPGGLKRSALIERLLNSADHARHLQQTFNLILMERRAFTNVSAKEWQSYLFWSFWNNRGWDEISAELLSADGSQPRTRAAARFYLDRNLEFEVLTRDIGRIFLGVDLECAQCHDHPSVDGYLQRHYYGINAFLKRSYLFTDPKTKKKSLAEKAEGDVTFTSVFTQESGRTLPRLLDLPEIPDPAGTAKQYISAPKRNVRAIPKYSRRRQLAQAMLSPKNAAFRRNMANRLWALMFGRGLVEPLDFQHADNPPSHPQLLDVLADEFANHGYDIRWFLRQLALTEAYQRSSRVAEEFRDEASSNFAVALLKPLTAEQLAWSVMQATDVTDRTLAEQELKLAKSEPVYRPSRRHLPRWRNEALHAAVAPHVAEFVATFSRQGGQKTSFDAAAHQALFLINGPLVQSWLKPRSFPQLLANSKTETRTLHNLTARLGKLENDQRFADELYTTVLSRTCSDAESAEVGQYIRTVGNRQTAATELVWALLSSAEFRFNH